MQTFTLLYSLILSLSLSACGSNGENFYPPKELDAVEGDVLLGAESIPEMSDEIQVEEAELSTSENTATKIKVQVGTSTFTATLEDNSAVATLVERMKSAPVVIEAKDYSGFEKVGSLETSLPADNRQITTQAGDIVLYNGNQIVLFYGSNSWSYTKLGQIDDLTGWQEALGSGDVQVTFTVAP